MSEHPYSSLPSSAYWRTAVAEVGAVPDESYCTPKWPIALSDRIATAGSCFAQHIGKRLRSNGYTVIDSEPAPALLPETRHQDYGFGLFSARYGNIYTARQMRELVEEAFGLRPSSELVWQKHGNYVDGLRPTVEPEGHSTPESVLAHRCEHLNQVRKMLLQADLLVFTLGLTETWEDTSAERVLPICPGTVAGEFDSKRHRFRNFTFQETLDDMVRLRSILHKERGSEYVRILLTVSPVPLTATASGKHVMLATSYSKAVLRAVAGQMSDTYADVDYFPSYEIVSNPYSEGMSYTANRRSVHESSVELVMKTFMSIYSGERFSDVNLSSAKNPFCNSLSNEEPDLAMATKCDEELLEAFGPART